MIRVMPRRELEDGRPGGYRESDLDFVKNNLDAAVELLEKYPEQEAQIAALRETLRRTRDEGVRIIDQMPRVIDSGQADSDIRSDLQRGLFAISHEVLVNVHKAANAFVSKQRADVLTMAADALRRMKDKSSSPKTLEGAATAVEGWARLQ